LTVILSEIRPGAYYDSVLLMQLQRSLAELPGVLDAGVVMATPANLELLATSDLLVDTSAGNDDLLIVVRADDEHVAADALAKVDDLMARRRSGVSQTFRPRSLEAALKQLPDARWVLVSVPGRFASGVARDALGLGLNVFLYSDNVSLEDEVSIKRQAGEKGLMVMGPDCGTAIVAGVGLGFANRVRRGTIGLVGASGTGLQAISSRIHQLGGGISMAIGTGGRDLSNTVGAITAHQGLNLLANDPQTEVIVLVSKPPEPSVAAELLTASQRAGKPVIVALVGYTPPARTLHRLMFANNLTEAADLAVHFSSGERSLIPDLENGDEVNEKLQGYIRGLFSGGTLAYEAVLGFQNLVTPLFSNVPVHASQRLKNVTVSEAHTVLDMGDDHFTQGRLHPMMDNDLRLRRLEQEAKDPEVAVIILDVVLGEGAHPDPTAELAPAISKAIEQANGEGRRLEVVAIVIGTSEDPQELQKQENRLLKAGAVVFQDTISAVKYVSHRLESPPVDSSEDLPLADFQGPLAAVNVGLETFYDSLISQGAQCVHLDWRPPASGNARMMDLLAKMKSS
jgi:FdrA protein